MEGLTAACINTNASIYDIYEIIIAVSRASWEALHFLQINLLRGSSALAIKVSSQRRHAQRVGNYLFEERCKIKHVQLMCNGTCIYVYLYICSTIQACKLVSGCTKYIYGPHILLQNSIYAYIVYIYAL